MIPRSVFGLLVAAMLGLPMVAVVLAGFGRALGSMGDESGGVVCSRLAQASAIIWALDLVTLVVLMALERWSDADSRQTYENQIPSDRLSE